MPKVNFIVPCLSTGHDWRLYNDGRYCWALLPAEKLIGGGCLPEVKISTDIKPDAINISHARTLAALNAPGFSYIVSCDADWPRLPWANYSICQNRLNVAGKHSSWMPLFSQQGLILRDIELNTVVTVGYFGRIDKKQEFESFGDELARCGLKFIIKGEDTWNDYSDVDVAISLRFLSKRRILRKPATKLVNAWLAGVPFVAMDEPAFSQIGIPGKNYLAAGSPREVIKEVLKLRDDPDLYCRIRDAGQIASEKYTDAAVTRRWIELIEHTLVPEFDKWKANRAAESVQFQMRYRFWKAKQLFRSLIVR